MLENKHGTWLTSLISTTFFQVLIEQYLSIYGDSTPAIFNSDSATASATTSAAAAAAGSSSSGAEDEAGGNGGVRKASVASTRSNASSSKSEFCIERPGFIKLAFVSHPVGKGIRAAF